MEIIFKGKHTGDEFAQSVLSVVHLFKDRYHVPVFREIHLTVTLVDELGQDVELVDNQNSTIYRVFEVHRQESELRGQDDPKRSPSIKLVVDNTKQREL
jgi:hypothetical protein